MSVALKREKNKQSPNKPWFMGWDRPVLMAACKQLFEEFSRTDQWGNALWDMRDVVIVLPSGSAQRRLGELLAMGAQEAGYTLYPPTIVTLGALPELLYVPKLPFANEVVQVLAWAAALRDSPLEDVQWLVPNPPPRDAMQQWLELARILANVHVELASDRLDFSQVVKALGTNHVETPRWRALANIQRQYLDELSRRNLWDVQSARLVALEKGEPATNHTIIVIGCVDLNRTQRGFLNAVSEHVRVWVAAPESVREGFDLLGCLEGEWWQSQTLNIPADSLLVGNSPSDQADLVAGVLAELGEDVHVRNVTLGVPDGSLTAELQYRLSQSNVRTRFGPGVALTKTEPMVLLALIGVYLRERSYSSLAALVRHPVVDSLIKRLVEKSLKEDGANAKKENGNEGQSESVVAAGERHGESPQSKLPPNWLGLLDAYYREAMPSHVDGFVKDGSQCAPVYRAVVNAVDEWLKPLRKKRGKKNGKEADRLDAYPTSEWVEPLQKVLADAYGNSLCDLSDPLGERLYSAVVQTTEGIAALEDIPEDLQPKVTVSEAIDWVIANVSGQLVPEPLDPLAIEMMGWLELAWDDAPVLVIAGLHDGVVPGSMDADAFLPNQLRRQLGMMDNARRMARDVYSMQVMLASRRDLRIVVGRTDAEGNPLVPSRLLLACDLADLPARVLHLVDEKSKDVLAEVERRSQPRSGGSNLDIPRPEQVKSPTRISVTAFRDYLKCPYRFYLQHVLKLRDASDQAVELDAAGFGNVTHEVLENFGDSPVKQSTDPEEIRHFLESELARIVNEQFGDDPPVAVLVQLEQVQQRLLAFAQKQAERAAEGWEIKYTETGCKDEDRVMIGRNKALCLIGRIDRIDYHPQSGQWAIWDYKTSESYKEPLKAHWNQRDGWIDLQLPLYLPIARQKLKIDGPATVGYISLPKRIEDIGFRVADFDPTQLDDAWAKADEIATRVINREFWPENDVIGQVEFDNFARICQTRVQFVQASPPKRKLFRFQGYQTQRVPADVVKQTAARLSSTAVRTPIKLEPLLIRASAGTGKTFQLSNRLLQILLSGQDVDTILATTFTRKAAGEILQRVLQRLARACIDPAAQQELARQWPDVDTSAAACLATLRRVTASIHRLRIGTLDSFFAKLATTFALDMGLPAGWTMMEPTSESGVQLQAISDMLHAHDRKLLLDLLRMLFKGESNRRVADEILAAVKSGYAIYRFTSEKAWDQLPLRAKPDEQTVESALRTLEICKLNHKTADGELCKLHLMASEGNWESVVTHGIYKNLGNDVPTYYRKELPSNLVVALGILRDRAAAEVLPIYRAQTLATYQVLQAYDQSYQDLLRNYRQLAFSDVAYFLAKWFDGNLRNQRGAVGMTLLEHRMDCGIRHLLLDEFQDTSIEQWNILRPLAEPLGGSPRSDQSFFCVGDSKQAIYSWRGGVAEIFESVARSIRELKDENLKQSYRSSPVVMQAVNEVFKHLERHERYGDCDPVAHRWSENFPIHDTARKSLDGYVVLENGPEPEDKEWTADQKKIAFLGYSADRIAELYSQTSSSIGVLFYKNDDVARMIGLLRERRVAASQDGGNPLTDSVAVELILSLVHLADHPGDGICAFHVRSSPLVAKLSEVAGSNHPESLARWFRKLVSRQGLGKTVEWTAERLSGHLSWWDQQRVDQLIRSAHAFDGTGGRLRDFENTVEQQRVALPSESQVKVMTIHKSKGLEFDAVFLPELKVDLVDGVSSLVTRGVDPCEPPNGVLRYMNATLQALLPEDWQRAFEANKANSLVESLCMLYVAMTRARQALYMFTQPVGKNPRQDFGSLLQSTMAHGSAVASIPSQVLYSQGNPNWFRATPKMENSESTGASAKASTRILLNDDSSVAPLRELPTWAPSRVVESQHKVPMASAFSSMRSEDVSFGKLIHAFFAMVHWCDEFAVDQKSLHHVAIATLSPNELQHISIPKAIDYFSNVLKQPEVRSILCKDRYQTAVHGVVADRVEIEKERAVSVILDGHMIKGAIDRLAILYQQGKPMAAEIIDYKTDSAPKGVTKAWLGNRTRQHRAQLALYARIVAQQFKIPLDRIDRRLVFLAGGRVVSVE